MVFAASACSAGTELAPGEEADITSGACRDLTLTCKPGFTSTEVGCAQSHVAGAHPLGHCIPADSMSISLGELAAPGSVLDRSVQAIPPGKSLLFTIGSNQISGVVGWEIDNTARVSDSDMVVKPMQAGQLGDKTFRRYTFTTPVAGATSTE